MTAAPLAFLDTATAVFAESAAAAGLRETDLLLADERVRLRFAGPALEPALLRATEHLQVAVDPAAPVSLTVSVFDSATTGARMPAPPWSQDDYRPKGAIAGFNDDRVHTQFEPGVDVLSLYDTERRAAVWWVSSPGIVPWWEPTFPLRTILHWWCAATPRQPVHAGAVGRDGHGVLVTGRSGSGKTTTSLACLRAGFDYAGDDYVLVDTATPRVFCLYSTAKLEPDNMARFPEMVSWIDNPDRLTDEKAIVYLQDHCAAQITNELAVDAVVVPVVTGLADSTVAPLAPSAALQALAPTTTFHLPGYGREVFTKLSGLVRAVPCFELRAGTDLHGVTDALDDLLETLR
ncbi:MAG: serine kinase [Acidimicrobiia bacterium]